MFRVETSEGKFDVRFRYNDVVLVKDAQYHGLYWRCLQEGEELPENAKIGLCTSCEISKLHPENEGRDRHETIAIDDVVYHFGKEVKPMTKAEGQKQAFAKTIQWAFPHDREIRKVFWKAFAQAIAAHRWMIDKIDRQPA